jgi:hypothetical protein
MEDLREWAEEESDELSFPLTVPMSLIPLCSDPAALTARLASTDLTSRAGSRF